MDLNKTIREMDDREYDWQMGKKAGIETERERVAEEVVITSLYKALENAISLGNHADGNYHRHFTSYIIIAGKLQESVNLIHELQQRDTDRKEKFKEGRAFVGKPKKEAK